MQNVKQALKKLSKQHSDNTINPLVTIQKTTLSDNRLLDEEISWLFARLSDTYGYTFKLNYEVDEKGNETKKSTTIKTWATALGARNFTIADLRRGLTKCLDSKKTFPPTLPEFIELCRLTDTDLGLPEYEQALAQGRKYSWSGGVPDHPAVEKAIDNIRWNIWRERPEFWEAQFKRNWDKIRAVLVTGGSLEAVDIPKLLPPPPLEKANPEKAKQRLQEMREALVGVNK